MVEGCLTHSKGEDMKFLGLLLIHMGLTTPSFGADPIIEDIAVLIARAYVVGAEFEVDGDLEQELFAADNKTSSGFEFLVQDLSGDCGLTVFVNIDGSIDKAKTKQGCY